MNPLQAKEYLYFPLEKGDFKVLPPRFEYQLIDQDNFRIGDTLFDAKKIFFNVQSHGNDEAVFFKWPAGLLKEGEIVIKDNAGKALWTYRLHPGSVKILAANQTWENQSLRTDIARVEVRDFPDDTLKLMRMLPFFKFCVHNEEALTRIYLCSKDLYFHQDQSQLKITARNTALIEPTVQINGQMVSHQGMIYLQSLDSALSMKAILASGASIELDTRLKAVDFLDAYRSAEDKITIKARGAEPVDPKQIIRRHDQEWTVQLPVDRPSIYLRSEGNIPILQEFVVNGKVRAADLQIPLLTDTMAGTYFSSKILDLRVPKNMSLKKTDKTSSLQKTDTGQTSDTWSWELQKLKAGETNKRFVAVQTPEGEYVGSAEVYRGLRNEAFIGMGLPSAIFDLRFFEALNTHFSWQAGYRAFNTVSSQEPGLSIASLDLNYRFTPGIQWRDPSHGLTLSYYDFNSDAFNLGAVSVGGFLTFKASHQQIPWFDWIAVRGKTPVSGSNKNYTVNGGGSLELVTKKVVNDWSWELGTRYESYNFSNNLNYVNFTRWSLVGGISSLF